MNREFLRWQKNQIVKNSRKTILFVIPSLAGGGAERILVYILEYLNRSRFRPVLAVFNEIGTYIDAIPKDVVVFDLKKRRALDFFRLIHRLSKIIQKEQPDLIVSFLTYTNYLSLITKSYSRHKIPIIIDEQNTLSQSFSDERFRYVKRWIVPRWYPKAEKIIAVSQGVKEDLVNTYFPFPDKISVIYNSVDIKKIRGLAREKVKHSWFRSNDPVIISAGRLTNQKNYPLLLDTIAMLQDQSNTRLIVLGDGEERTVLEKRARRLGISDKVDFIGFQKNPYKYIAKATMFVLPSSWEGFCVVIVEAMACGVPVISTDCPSGPGELITNNINGLLVPVNDIDAMADAILRLLNNTSLRRRLAEAGRKRAEDFRVEKMIEAYQKLFEKVA